MRELFPPSVESGPHIESPDGLQPAYAYTEGSKRYIDLNKAKDIAPRPNSGHQTAEIWDGFDLVHVVTRLQQEFELDESKSLYLLVFRSHRAVQLDESGLDELTAKDYAADKEARGLKDKTGRPSLLHYFKGMPDENGYCMSWCIWTDREMAKQAAGPDAKAHREAAERALTSYTPGSVHTQKYFLTLTESGLLIRTVPKTLPHLAQLEMLSYADGRPLQLPEAQRKQWLESLNAQDIET